MGKLDCRGLVQRNIKFARPFSERPSVITWLSGLDLRVGLGKRVEVVTTSSDKDGFAIDVRGPNPALAWSSVSWIAITDSSGCSAGSFGFDHFVTTKSNEGSCTFPKGKFAKPPQVLVAFSSFNINGSDANPRLAVCTAAVTTEGFKWKVYAWCDSSIKAATVQWIAIPAR